MSAYRAQGTRPHYPEPTPSVSKPVEVVEFPLYIGPDARWFECGALALLLVLVAGGPLLAAWGVL